MAVTKCLPYYDAIILSLSKLYYATFYSEVRKLFSQSSTD